LYIMGQEDHMFLPSISKLVENHSSSSLIVVPNCGHVVNVEQPEFFNRTVIKFIQQL
jgi:pimeloyl-ACP methyl ester carboxylesterase